jgi:hypothetical protein
LLRHAFVEVPAVSVVKIEMIEKCFGTQQWVHAHVFMDGNCTIKIHFQSQFHQWKEVEEVPILFVDGVIVR